MSFQIHCSLAIAGNVAKLVHEFPKISQIEYLLISW